MGKKEKPKFLDYLNAVKKADREREIAQHGKLISTRPLRIVKSKKVYDRKRDKRDCSKYNDGSLFFCGLLTGIKPKTKNCFTFVLRVDKMRRLTII